MITLMLALALLVPQPVSHQQVDTATNGATAHQQANGTTNGTVKNNPAEPKHGSAGPDDHQRNVAETPQPTLPRPRWVEHPWRRLMSLSDTDRFSFALFVVTTFYLLATVGILLAMVKSNKHAKAAHKEGKDAADADRELMGKQLAEMKTTSVDMHDLAVAAEEAAEFARQQSSWAEVSTNTMIAQMGVMVTQAKAAAISAEAALDSAKMAKLLERPWITASIAARDPIMFFRKSGVTFSFFLVLENLGRSVATDISYAIEFFPIGEGHADEVVRERQHVISAKLEASSGAFSFPLFPKEVGRLHVLSNVEPEAIEECATQGDDVHYVVLCVAGEITYRFASSDSKHTTRFAYYVGQYAPESWRTVIHIGQTLPPDQIVFLKNYLASYAD